MKPWKQEIVEALRALGGEADLHEIYERIAHQRSPLPTSWKAIIRNVIESHSSDSDNFRARTSSTQLLAWAGAGVIMT